MHINNKICIYTFGNNSLYNIFAEYSQKRGNSVMQRKTDCASGAAAITRNTLGARIKRELSKNKGLYIMSIPVVLYYLIFMYGPMFGLVIAFKDFNIVKGILESPWVGLKHFQEFFANAYFWRLLKNTLLLSFYSILFGFPLPIIFAILMNELSGSRFKRTVQTVTYLPHFISLVVMCGMITDFLSSSGVISQLVAAISGTDAQNLLGDPKYFRTIYVVSGIWQSIGWESIVFLAALTGVDTQLYEAATIDGAGRFRKIISVTLPAIIPTIVVMFIMRVGSVMTIGYEKIILLYSEATWETADVISSFVFRRGLSSAGQYSYTTAVGMFQSVTNLIVLCVANWISKKFTDSGLF